MPAQKFLPSEAAAKAVLSEQAVTVEGVLVNEGTNYFTDRRLVLKDTVGSVGGLRVKPWVEIDVAPGTGGAQKSPGPVLSDYLGKRVVFQGVIKEVTVKGVGKTKVLEVESVKIID